MSDPDATATARPLPIPQPESQAYWDGARQHRLVLQRCSQCHQWIHPPRYSCPSCRSRDVVPTDASGFGVVFSWSVMHQSGVPGFDDVIPFAVALIELAEQRRLLAVGQVLDCPADELRVGLPVEVCFEDRGDVVLPQWRVRR